MVDEAVRYIRELETALANKVNTDGGLVLPEFEMGQQQPANSQSASSSENNSYHSLESIPERFVGVPKINNSNSVSIKNNRTELRNLVSQFIMPPQARFLHDCSEVLRGLHQTSISNTSLDRE